MESETVKLLEKLTPAEKLGAIELLADSLRRAAKPAAASQNQNMRRLLQALENLPVCNPSDGFASSDHDREIYREQPGFSSIPARGSPPLFPTTRTMPRHVAGSTPISNPY